MSSKASSCTLIINADDLGYEPRVSEGIVEAMVEGVVSSATVMVNGPHSADGAARARAHQLQSLGLHLNLARWAPLSKVPGQWLTGAGELDEAKAGDLSPEAVLAEAEAQLGRFEELFGHRPTHLDVHKHLHRHPGVLEGVCRAALQQRLPVRSVDGPMRQQLKRRGVPTNDELLGDAGATAYWTLPQLELALGALPSSGVVELMCHPGYTPKAVASGYAAQREVELATFTNPTARALLERRELIPASWALFAQP